MKDVEGVQFLQWCLPRLRLRWKGYRKVRRQVYKRIGQRMQVLGLTTLSDYRAYLECHTTEWAILDSLSWIPISRFYRDKRVYEFLQQEVLARLTEMVTMRGETELRCWSVGCAAGEEPYSLAILWICTLADRFPGVTFRVLATDINPDAIRRAEAGCYPMSSVKDLPQELLRAPFILSGEQYCIKPEYREPVRFLVQDIRQAMPPGSFHLILCRYVVLTYFEEQLQRDMVQRIEQKLDPSGALVIGTLESLPEGISGLEPWSSKCGIYRKSQTSK
jgi:chemotaxis protein methyltransferase CheR